MPCILNAKTFSSRHFTVENGLPSSEVYDVLEDNNGFMWFATDRGVARFDGYDFEVFNTDNGLPDNVILSLFKDYLGRVWFVSYSGKLSYFQNDKIHLYPYNELVKKKLQSPTIISFYVDDSDCVHIGSESNGYLQINRDGSYLRETTTSSYPYNIKVFDNHHIFFRDINEYDTGREYLRLNKNNEEFIIPIPAIPKYYYGISHLCAPAGSNSLYFSAGPYLFHKKGDSVHLCYQAKERITTIYSKESFIYVCEYKNGLKIIDCNKPNENFGTYLDDNSISRILISENGETWVCTLENGIYYIPNFDIQTYDKNDGFCSSNIYEMVGNSKFLLVGDIAGCLTKIRIPSLTIDTIIKRENVPVNLVYNQFNDEIYALHDESIFCESKIVPMKLQKTLSPFCFIDSNVVLGECTLFNKNQLCSYDFNEITVYYTDNESIARDNLQVAFKTDQNRILLGCKDRLLELIEIPNDTIYHIENLGIKTPLFNTRFVEIVDYNGFDFIAATRGEGILFVKNDIPFALKEKHGLLSNQITALFIDSSQTIWVGTSLGLNIISRTEGIINFRMEDGLISNEITDIFVNETHAYIGTKKGLTVLDRDKIKKNKSNIPVLFRSITTENNAAILISNNEIHLKYKEPILNIKFAGVDYKSMGTIEYKYRLNSDENWQFTNKNSLLLSNLPSGVYDLEIYASNDSKNWSTNPALLTIHVAFPLWQTIGFQIPVALLTILFFALIYRFSIRRIRNVEQIKRQIQNLRFEALSAQMNPHFMFNSLNSIQNFIMNNDRKESTRYLAKFAKLMRKTLDHSLQKNITLKDEVEALNLYLELESLRFDHQIKYQIEIDPEIDLNTVIIPALLVQPLVENSILHGLRPKHGEGTVKISFQRLVTFLRLEVIDDGVGRNLVKKNNADNHKSSGMALTKERIELFASDHGEKAKFEIIDCSEKGEPSGTIVRIVIPYIQRNNEIENRNY